MNSVWKPLSPWRRSGWFTSAAIPQPWSGIWRCCEEGVEVEKVRCCDMFGWTTHVEVVYCLHPGEFVEVLNFRHFARYMSFKPTGKTGQEKADYEWHRSVSSIASGMRKHIRIELTFLFNSIEKAKRTLVFRTSGRWVSFSLSKAKEQIKMARKKRNVFIKRSRAGCRVLYWWKWKSCIALKDTRLK